MAVNTNPSSRRALLAAATGGAIALVAESLARPQPARANDPNDVLLGGLNESMSPTVLKSGNLGEVLRVEGAGGDGVFAHSDSKCGLRAESETHHGIEAHAFGSGVSFGVYGISDHFIGLRGEGGQTGVHGSSDAGFGVAGISMGNVGVHGDGDKAGVFGGSSAGTGVQGRSGTGWGVTGGSDGTEFGASGGVFGMSDKTVGVFGLSAQGIAVEGRSDHDPATGTGVKGYSTNGDGVVGESEEGTAVRATAVTPAATALRVEGRVAFQTAGLGTIAAGTKSATVNPGVPVTAATKVLVTLMSNPGLRAVKYVSVNPPGGTFTVHLTGLAAGTPISFAWFVID